MVAGAKGGIKFLSITLQSGLQYSIACTSFGRIQNQKQTNKKNSHIESVDSTAAPVFTPPPLLVLTPPQIQVHTELLSWAIWQEIRAFQLSPPCGPFCQRGVWPSAAKWVGFWCLCPGVWLPQQSLCFYFPSQWNDTLGWSVAPLCWKTKRGPTSRTGTIATRTYRSISQSLECPCFCNSKKSKYIANVTWSQGIHATMTIMGALQSGSRLLLWFLKDTVLDLEDCISPSPLHPEKAHLHCLLL